MASAIDRLKDLDASADPWVRPIIHSVAPERMSAELPLMLELAELIYPADVPMASGIADERPGHVTHYWTTGLTTQPNDSSDVHGDYDMGR